MTRLHAALARFAWFARFTPFAYLANFCSSAANAEAFARDVAVKSRILGIDAGMTSRFFSKVSLPVIIQLPIIVNTKIRDRHKNRIKIRGDQADNVSELYLGCSS